MIHRTCSIFLIALLLLVGTASATTYYLRDIPATGVVPNAKQSADTITDDFATTNATYAAPAKMLETDGSGTFSNSGTGTSTADLHYSHYGTWVSDPVAAQEISGTVTIGLSMLETRAKQNNMPRVKIYRWYANDTYASDLLALIASGTEVGITASLVTYFSSTAITTRTFNEGDRIVIEIEDSADPAETYAVTHALQYGGTASGAYGSYVTFSDTITYPAVAPVAGFSGAPTSGDVPLQVTFTDSSTNTPTNWDWYMWANETKTSDDQNPVITFTEAGTYNIRLYASNTGGGDWENKSEYITANTPPPAGQEYGNWTEFVVNSTSAQTNYQVKMILDNRTGTSSTTLFYTNGTTRSDWMDIKWTDTSNATLSFWKENRTDTATNTTWWIKVPSIANDNTTKIRLFYGNASKTTSDMDMENTFIFSDDFPGATLNTTKWVPNAAPAVANSIATLTGGSWTRIRSNATTANTRFNTSVPFAFESRASMSSNTARQYWGMETDGTTSIVLDAAYVSGTVRTRTLHTGSETYYIVNIPTGTYERFSILVNKTTSAKFYANTTLLSTHTANIADAAHLFTIDFSAVDAAAAINVDWIAMRKYAEPEPFLTLPGGTSPPAVAPVASWTSNASSHGLTNQYVTFTDTSTNTPTSWNWSFGDGQYSTSQNPSHSYTTDGSKTVILNASNSAGYNLSSANIMIYPTEPTPNYTRYGVVLTSSEEPWLNGVIGELTIIVEGNPQILVGNTTVFKGWYSGGYSSPATGYAESTNGVNWTRYPSNPILTGGSCIFVFKDNGKYYMYRSLSGASRIDLYNSTDGISWTLDTLNVIVPTGGTFDAQGVVNTYAWNNSGTWNVMYEAYNGSVFNIGLATGSSPRSLSKYAGNPVIWDGGSRGAPAEYKINGSVHSVIVHGAISGTLPVDLYKYDSIDNQTWLESPTSSFFNRTGTDEGEFSGSGQVSDLFVVNFADTSYMYYVATPDGTTNTSGATTKLATTNGLTTTLGSSPVASFTINRNPVRIPQSITVTDTSTNTPTSWQWAWGDGTANSTTQNPTHTYTKRGKFDIYLTATNAGGSGTTATATSVRVIGYENYY